LKQLIKKIIIKSSDFSNIPRTFHPVPNFCYGTRHIYLS
jgi:hypothetical protein